MLKFNCAFSLPNAQSCASDTSGGLVDIGCLATGYVPSRSVTFTWRDKGKGSDISDFVQYPEVQRNGAYSVFTQIKVKAEDWEKSNTYTCNANQGQTAESTDVTRMGKRFLSIFACLAKGFSPKTHKLKWYLGSKEVTENVTSLPEVKDNGDSLFSASSFLSLPEKQWKSDEARVTCVFERKPGSIVQESDPITVNIFPPTPEKFFLNEEILLGCKVTGDLSNLGAIEWENADGSKLVAMKEVKENGNSRVSWLSISYEEWSNGTEFVCIVTHSDLPLPKRETYQRENAAKAPSVFILGPAEQRITTLLCLILDFFPADIDVYWELDGLKLSESQYSNSAVFGVAGRGDDGGYSMHSKLHIPQSDRNDGHYSCVVKHESMNLTLPMSPHTTDLNTLEAINEEDENINNISNDTAQEDNLTEIWNTALTFIILFLVSVVYSICVTFVKVGARVSPAEFRGKDLRQATPLSAHSVCYYKIIKMSHSLPFPSGLINHLYTFFIH
uniref:Ig-like domain-containing protein n=1 Tax=Paramormyrops kingsleyae TaxID=1676925 RepID=A0A3B3SXT6_9TELE